MTARRSGSRRAAARCHRRGARHATRTKDVVRQENQSSMEGPDESPKAAKAVRAWKARRA